MQLLWPFWVCWGLVICPAPSNLLQGRCACLLPPKPINSFCPHSFLKSPVFWCSACLASSPQAQGMECMVQFYVVQCVFVICPRGRCVQNPTVLVWKGKDTFYPSLPSPPTVLPDQNMQFFLQPVLPSGWARVSQEEEKSLQNHRIMELL